jgi:CRISPR-associated protein Csm5
MTVFNLTLKTLSPIHIGDGNELRQDFDFSVYQERTYRLAEDAILADKEAQLRPDRSGHYPVPGKLLIPADYTNPSLFRYVLRGIPRSTQTDARVKSFIKDVYDQPYIPGSSLKGALRTALAWTGWKEVNPLLDQNAIGQSKSWAGQRLERKLFGADPNHDLLRALHVSDLHSKTPAIGKLLLVNAQVLTKRSHASPIELEAIAGDVVFAGSLTMDETLFNDASEPILHFKNRRHWLDELAARLNRHSQARIARLVDWYEEADGAEAVAGFYRQLRQAQLTPNQALVQVGWGGGWDSKTFWTHLQTDPQFFEALIDRFRMHKAGRNTPPRKTGDPFPRSRRAAMVIKAGVARAAAPFGWCLLEITPGEK